MSVGDQPHVIVRSPYTAENEALVVGEIERQTGKQIELAPDTFLFMGQKSLEAALAVSIVARAVAEMRGSETTPIVTAAKNEDAILALGSFTLTGDALRAATGKIVSETNAILDNLASPYHLPE